MRRLPTKDQLDQHNLDMACPVAFTVIISHVFAKYHETGQEWIEMLIHITLWSSRELLKVCRVHGQIGVLM